MWCRLIVAGLALGVGGCGAASEALVTVGRPVAGQSHLRPRLAMVRTRTGNTPLTDLVLVALGANRDQVLSAASHRGRLEPLTGPAAWSPDGQQLGFARITSGYLRGAHGVPYFRHDIFIIDVNGSGFHQLTHTGDAWAPVWSPDGKQIAFSRAHTSPDGQSLTGSIWTIRPNGTGARQLTPSVSGRDDLPSSFSPGGQLLAFARTDVSPPGFGVYLLRVADGTVRKLASAAADPSFSPDGKSIVLASTRDQNGTISTGQDSQGTAAELYLVDLNGRHWRRLTRTRDVGESYPSFSSDGKRIAYERTVDRFHHAVFEMNADGSCQTRIRDDRTDNIWYFAPTWQPGQSRIAAGRLHCRHGG